MSSRPFLSKAADYAQRASVLGLLSFLGFQLYQVGHFVRERQIESPYMHSTYRQDVADKVKEEYKKDNVIDGRNERDWYADDDDSYRKEQVRANITTPEFKKQYNQQQEKK